MGNYIRSFGIVSLLIIILNSVQSVAQKNPSQLALTGKGDLILVGEKGQLQEEAHQAFLAMQKAAFKEMIRLSIQRTMRILDPLYWITAIRAKYIIGINNETSKQFPLSLFNKNKFIVESAIAHEGSPEENTIQKKVLLVV